ncbi:MAG: histidine kinase [Myxococcota bacterium]
MSYSLNWKYWCAHVVSWVGAVTVVFMPHGVLYSLSGAPLHEVGFVSVSCYVFALATSIALALAYSSIPEHQLTRRSGIARVAVLALSGILIWTSGLVLTFSFTTYLSDDERTVVPLWCIATTSLFVVAWSAVFFLRVFDFRFRRLRERALTMELLAQEAKLASLRSQLHPHFLFNSLNSVVGLMEEDVTRAKQMTRDLAGLLRRALECTRSDLSTLDEEIEFLELYLRCEQVRFGADLSVKLEIPASLGCEPIPSMLLQPLVENAVKHGMRGSDHAEVVLTAKLDFKEAVIEVRNTGNLLRESSSNGAGLQMVRERLAARYGVDARFEMVQEERWVVARVTLPRPASTPPKTTNLSFVETPL